ncbi:UNVERIFIED_CONTAM: hypothetical protein K2H54_056667, partial [Gekko kuhli]
EGQSDEDTQVIDLTLEQWDQFMKQLKEAIQIGICKGFELACTKIKENVQEILLDMQATRGNAEDLLQESQGNSETQNQQVKDSAEDMQNLQDTMAKIRKKKKLHAEGKWGKRRQQRKGRKGNTNKLKNHAWKFKTEEGKQTTSKVMCKREPMNVKLFICKERSHVEALKLKDRLLIYRKKIKVYKR